MATEERYVETSSDVPNIFRDCEKNYRIPPVLKGRKTKVTDFTNVIDFQNLDNNTEENKKLITPATIYKLQKDGIPVVQQAYTLANVEGFYFIPNPFTEEQQRHWVQRCLLDFTVGNPTNVSNLKKQPYWTEWKPEYAEPLRWATLGYHFQWTARRYMDEYRGEFPADLAELTQGLAQQLGFEMTAEAATINFYPIAKQMMGGHLDDAEDDMSKPIVSCSFGNTVVFLIGGRTRDIAPTALYIRSGDVVLMGGHSRYCYHGVPRMLEYTAPSFLCPNDSKLDGESPSTVISDRQTLASNYIQNARINMNVRQVRVHESN